MVKSVKVGTSSFVLPEITVGMEFKSFSDWMGFMGVKYARTSPTTLQSLSKQLQRYFEWEKIGAFKIRITFVRSNADLAELEAKELEQQLQKAPIPEKRLTYAQTVLPSLFTAMKKLHAHNTEYFYLEVTNREFYEKVLLCHPKLFDTAYTNEGWKQDFPELAKLNYSQECMANLVKSNYKKANQVKEAIKQYLMENCIAHWTETYIITIAGKESIATPEQAALCLEATSQALKQMKLTLLKYTYLTNRRAEFESTAFEYSTKHFGITSFRQTNVIGTTSTIIRNFLDLSEKELLQKRKESQTNLNKTIVSSLVKSTNKIPTLPTQEEPTLENDVSTLALQIALGFYTLAEFQEDSANLHQNYRNTFLLDLPKIYAEPRKPVQDALL